MDHPASTEELFLERGLATFSVDGPGQGEAERLGASAAHRGVSS